MGRLLGIARFTFHEGRVEEFKRLARQCQDIVAARDTGTLRYEVYLNTAQTQALVIEEYADETALREHGEHLGQELSEAILATAGVRGELLGDLSPELRAQLSEGPVTAFLPASL